MPGSLREEVLANVARQLVELRVYLDSFMRNPAGRCTRRSYAELAQYARSRYIRLICPTVRYLLDVDGSSGGLPCPSLGRSPLPFPRAVSPALPQPLGAAVGALRDGGLRTLAARGHLPEPRLRAQLRPGAGQ
jgi:hypothetical protein